MNDDGLKDVIICGNLYTSEIETPRNDAGMGLVLFGDYATKFKPLSLLESGFFAPHDAKDMAFIRLNSLNKNAIIVANNDDRAQIILINE